MSMAVTLIFLRCFPLPFPPLTDCVCLCWCTRGTVPRLTITANGKEVKCHTVMHAWPLCLCAFLFAHDCWSSVGDGFIGEGVSLGRNSCCAGGVVDAGAAHGTGGVVGAALGAIEVVGTT
jgi:hypothetical protein